SDNAGKSGIVEMLPSAAGRVCTAMGSTSGTVTACTGDADCTGVCSSSTSRCVGGVYDGMMCGSGTTIDCTSTCQLGGATHLLNGVYSITKSAGAGTTLFLVGNDMSGNSFVDAVDTTQIGEAACAATPSSSLDGGCESSPITPTVLLAPGDYSLGPTTLSSSGELTFIGVRFSDGASVVGNCTATACTVLSATAPAVSTLVRIN
ncbi:MAG TPA: hypothetical protein VL326_11675, partial [Kofleriaceae bacterium]|nr:hypothetical protein [Kofleriaceae bacterium]